MSPIASVDGLKPQLEWSTQTDWDNAVTVNDVIAENGTIWLTIGQADWDDESTGSFPSYLTQETLSGTDEVFFGRALSGDKSFRSQLTSGPVGNLLWSFDIRNGQYETDIIYNYQETVNSTMYAMTLVSSSDDHLLSVGTNNPQPAIDDGDGSQNLTSSVNPNYDTYRRWTVTIDWSNQTYDATWDDIGGTSTSQSVSNRSLKTASTYDISKVAYSLGGTGTVWGGDDTDTWTDDTAGAYASSGLLTSATKSFTTARQPDISSTTYTLNGESIELQVIGSPGTASEEQVSANLDGSSSFTLSWSNSHTDFRVEPNLSTTSEGTTPLFEGVVLS